MRTLFPFRLPLSLLPCLAFTLVLLIRRGAVTSLRHERPATPRPNLGQPVLQPPSVEEVPAGAPQADGDEPADGGLGLPLENGDNAPAEGEDLPAPDEPLAFPKSVAPLPPVSQSSLRPPKASAAS